MCVLLSLLVHVYVDACTSESLLLDLPWCLTARLGQLTGEPQRSTHFCLPSPNLQAHTTMASFFLLGSGEQTRVFVHAKQTLH